MVLARNIDRGAPARALQMLGHLAIIHRPVHADVEELLAGARIVDRRQDGADEIVDMDEVAAERPPVGVVEQRHGPIAGVALCIGFGHQRLPVRPAENVVAEGEGISEVVLLHDPRRPQATPVDAVLDADLLQHHLFQHLGERVAAGIGGVRHLLGHRRFAAIEEMADAGIAADENELLRGRALAEGFEQPEQPLHGDVDDVVRRLLAGRQMHHMGDAGNRRLGHGALGDRATHDLDAIVLRDRPVMAERPHAGAGEAAVGKEPCDEVAADLSGRSGHQDEHESSLISVLTRFLSRPCTSGAQT